jgi:hypothetical protein
MFSPMRFLLLRKRSRLNPETGLWYGSVVANGGTVSQARLAVVDAFISAEKVSDAWYLTDDYWGLWGENAAQALTSLKQRRLAAAVNSPTFTADRDYTFDGATSYLNTNFVPATHGIALTGDNQRLAVYERTNVSTGGYSSGALTGTTNVVAVNARNATVIRARMNCAPGDFTLSVSDSRGFSSASRASGGTTMLGYKNGIRLTDRSGLTVGSSLPTHSLYIGGLNNAGAPGSLRGASAGLVCIGAPLSDAQELAQYNAVQAWATAIGAQV